MTVYRLVQMPKKSIKINILISIIFLSLSYLIITWFANNVIITDAFYFTSFEKILSIDKIEELILFNKKTEWLTYILMPFISTIKYSLVSLVVFIGIKLFEVKINLRECFKIVLLAELIPLISSVTKTLYFYIYPPRSLEFIQNFNPLGITNFLKNDSIPKYLLYPLQQINLFEVGYWLLLAFGIKTLGNIDFKKALKITSLSYGVGLAIWCIFIVFLQLQFS
jgi:hypothetical protein